MVAMHVLFEKFLTCRTQDDKNLTENKAVDTTTVSQLVKVEISIAWVIVNNFLLLNVKIHGSLQ